MNHKKSGVSVTCGTTYQVTKGWIIGVPERGEGRKEKKRLKK